MKKFMFLMSLILCLALNTVVYADEKGIVITNIPLDVNVSNTPLQVEIANGGTNGEVFVRTPFVCSEIPGSPQQTCHVPPDQLLVIEYVNVGVTLLPLVTDQRVLWIGLQYEGGDVAIPLYELGDSGVFIGSQQLRLYASPGSQLRLELLSNLELNPDEFFSFHVSGYLIDPESPSLAP